MDKIRIGNDIAYEWVILRHDRYIEDFTAAKIVELKISNDSTGETYLPVYNITNNVITVYFPASVQIKCGVYSLHLNYTKDNASKIVPQAEYTVDYEGVFELVASTSEETPPTPEDGKVTSYIYRNRDGANGMSPEIGSNGNWFIGSQDTGKPSAGKSFTYDMFTPEQIAGIQKPAVDAAETVSETISNANKSIDEAIANTSKAIGNVDKAIVNVDKAIGNVDKAIGNVDKAIVNIEAVEDRITAVESSVTDAEQHRKANEQNRQEGFEEMTNDINAILPNLDEKITQHNSSGLSHSDIRNEVKTSIGLPEFDEATRILTFRTKNGSVKTIHLKDDDTIYTGGADDDGNLTVDVNASTKTIVANFTPEFITAFNGKAEKTDVDKMIQKVSSEAEAIALSQANPKILYLWA